SLSFHIRFELALKDFEHTAQCDGMIANYFGAPLPAHTSPCPRTFNMQFIKQQDLRYGENSHQQAAFYVEPRPREVSVATAAQLQGKELFYNKIADTDAALACVKVFAETACAILKHAKPWCLATGAN